MQQRYEEIKLPSELARQSGLEILRVGVVEHDLQVVLKTCFDKPADWGAAAVQILQYAAKIYERETGMAAEDAYGKMVEMFMQMVMKPVEGAIGQRMGDN